MNNSQRSISFTIGLMGTLVIMMLFNPFIPEAFFSKFSLLYSFFYVLWFVLLQNSYKTFLVTRIPSPGEPLFFCVPILKPYYDRLYYYGILILLAFSNGKAFLFSYPFVTQGLIGLLLIEGLFRYSRNSLKAQFTPQGILIKGFDGRLDIPFNTPVYNHQGFYPYSEISHYSISGENLELVLYNHKGTLLLQMNSGLQGQLMGFFQAKGIPVAQRK